MKKVLSFAIVFTMLLSLVSMLGITASANALEKTYEEAKDGDVLYNALFNQKDGVFVPKVFSAASKGLEDGHGVDVSADGKSVTLHHSSSENGRVFWGGEIEGLSLGEGKQYTVTATVSFTRHRSGIYLTWGDMESEAATDNWSHEKTIGIYGNEKDGCFMYGGDVLYGKYASNGDYVGWYLHDATAPEDVCNDVVKDITFVIDGYDMYVWMDGYFFYMTTIPATDGYDNLGTSEHI